MQLKLVSFTTCPYVQRAVIVLRHKQVAHETTFIDLAAKPDWFLKLSPRGKVPLLVADGTPLFESQAICEFLEETHPDPALMPTSAVERARDRAWFAFASEDLFLPIYKMSIEAREQAYRELESRLASSLQRVQQELGDRRWLSGNGSRFGMADVAFAPAWTRLEKYEQHGKYAWPSGTRTLQAWAQRVLEVPAVHDSVPPEFEASLLSGMRKASAFLVS